MPSFQHGSISLRAPEGWRDESTIVVVGPYIPALKTQPRVMVSHLLQESHDEPDESPKPASEISRLFCEHLPSAIEGAQVRERRSLTLRGLEGYLVIYEAPVEGVGVVVRLQLFATRDRELFTASSDAADAVYRQIGPQLIQVMESLQYG